MHLNEIWSVACLFVHSFIYSTRCAQPHTHTFIWSLDFEWRWKRFHFENSLPNQWWWPCQGATGATSITSGKQREPDRDGNVRSQWSRWTNRYKSLTNIDTSEIKWKRLRATNYEHRWKVNQYNIRNWMQFISLLLHTVHTDPYALGQWMATLQFHFQKTPCDQQRMKNSNSNTNNNKKRIDSISLW